MTQKQSQLKKEAKIYKKLQGGIGIPKFYGFKTEGRYNIMVMEMLGPSLEKLFKVCGKKLSITTGFLIAEQMVL